MSFIGAVAPSVRRVLAQYAADVHLPCLIIGAGNFTVPSVLRSAGFAGTITACDVTLYTSALGAYLSGWTLEAREREDCPEHLRGLLRTGFAAGTDGLHQPAHGSARGVEGRQRLQDADD